MDHFPATGVSNSAMGVATVLWGLSGHSLVFGGFDRATAAHRGWIANPLRFMAVTAPRNEGK